MNLQLGALAPSIEKQIEAAGIQIEGDVTFFDRIANAISLLHVHGYLSDSETQKARQRLIKQLKVKS